MTFREHIARFLAPEYFQEQRNFTDQVNQRVADALFKMDEFEPFLRKYHVIFSADWQRAEDRLDEASKMQLFMWAYGMERDPNFKYLTDWIINTQGNATITKAQTDSEWFYGRAAIATMRLFVREVGRLSSHYQEIMESRGQTFDEHLTVE